MYTLTGGVVRRILQAEQSFQVQEGDKIVIDKSKLRPVFKKNAKGTIITIEAKEVSDDQH